MRFSRNDFESVITAGIKVGELVFSRELANVWLTDYPNDIRCNYFIATISHLENKPKEAIEFLSDLLMRDPENIDAYELLSKVEGVLDKKAVSSFVHVLTGKIDDISTIFPWAVTLRAVRNGIRKREFVNSERMLRNLLDQEPNNPLVAIEHCKLSSEKDENKVFKHLAEIYSQRWPECLYFKIFLASALMLANEEARAVELMHKCIRYDAEGLVVRRLLGPNHDFVSLWPQEQYIDFERQIPSSIAVALKWNLLHSGSSLDNQNDLLKEISKTSKHHPDRSLTNNFDKKNSKEKTVDTPVYVILSSVNGLERKYGKKTTDFIIKKLEELSNVLNAKQSWNAIKFLPDELRSTQNLGLDPIKTVDAWQIKLTLHDLENQLRKQSRMIGAVLIIGGHDVVPFHNLPNPTDDSDVSVFSDNPYSSSSSNYLMTEWPVGRLPGEAGTDPGLLLEQLRQIIDFHRSQIKNTSFVDQIITGYGRNLNPRRIFRDLFKAPKDFGYSAAVWRRSSLATFRPLGKGSELRVTPPYDSDTIDVENLMKAKCGHFNLHGLADTPDWYGQRDFSETPTGPDFPVAITASQIENIRNNVDLVFTEACYGGNIIDKTVDNSMALRLISIECQGLVASTCIAYGSVFTPLIGADLLGFIFWKYIKDGYSFGESLLQAKIGLTKVMMQRQGYIDGEDQKTLISFVLYGDPLGYLEPNIYLEKKPLMRVPIRRDLKIYSDRDMLVTTSPRISKDLSNELGELMQSYIPSLNNANIKYREHKIKVNKILQSRDHQVGGQEDETELKNITQVMVSQKTKEARLIHEHYARLTLDDSGKVIKLAVSR